MAEDRESKSELLNIVREALERDQQLRDKHHIGHKFKFIRDRLEALLKQVEEAVVILKQEEEKKEYVISEDEVMVYFYLFNAQGIVLKTWQKMLNPAVFYEYSVNRPIYLSKNDMNAYLRSKTNQTQHAYIEVVIKKDDVLTKEGSEKSKDAIGGPLIKVREGSLRFDRLIALIYNGNEYILGEGGELVKKS